MGVAKAWRYSGGVLVLAKSHHLNHKHNKLKQQKQQKWVGQDHHCWLWQPAETAVVGGGGQRRRISWTVVCGMMLFVLGLISFFTGHIASDLEWYSHRIVKRRLWKNKVGRISSGPVDIWKSKFSKFYYGCSERSPYYAPPTRQLLSNGYLLIAASGGLNQQRTGITDAVVVARILNATLVIPELDHHSYWKDDSDFANIFDVDWFISFLAKDVPVVKRVPDKYMRSLEKPPYTMRVPRKSEPRYYLDEVLPILLRRRVLQLTKFDYRLASDLDEELQRLRCRVNYHALRFTKPIQDLGKKIVMEMRKMASSFIAIHLRFEPDMLAFSGCYYGGGDKERYELGEIRKRWATLPETSPDGERKRGKCPLTPHEVGLMLRALGFENNMHLYVASGEIYGGEETLKPLRDLFPNYYTKEMLASQELEPFLPYSSQLAAVDYIVCDESDVFGLGSMKPWSLMSHVPREGVEFSQQGLEFQIWPALPASRALRFSSTIMVVGPVWWGFSGGSANPPFFPVMMVLGLLYPLPILGLFGLVRRYMGHKRTIRPNAKKLNALFLKREKLPWETFAKKVKASQQGFLGEPNEMKGGRGEFHEYPSTCICKKPFKFSYLDTGNQTVTKSLEYGRNEEDQGVHNV
ncbi:GDP-fucose protein O-fucosyltransferase [Cynara cardunculus var. scolymus]|uniref:O-fucosyltransferase family protein n=1 Tax=Cynara cardunculus var. scolymus TaxID=59895 RepID=A0A103XJH7_CYNCS|nr:GDP-fucose protein O-fucosyltransferase [Cynara cardunculus var. scolymus]